MRSSSDRHHRPAQAEGEARCLSQSWTLAVSCGTATMTRLPTSRSVLPRCDPSHSALCMQPGPVEAVRTEEEEMRALKTCLVAVTFLSLSGPLSLRLAKCPKVGAPSRPLVSNDIASGPYH